MTTIFRRFFTTIVTMTCLSSGSLYVQAAGEEIPVNAYTTGNQEAVAVAMDGDGNFVIVWQDSSQDGAGYGIAGQLFSPDGQPANGEFQVNTYTTGNQRWPEVSMNGTGDFVVTWVSEEGAHPGGGLVRARQFNSDGTPEADDFQVNNVEFFAPLAPNAALSESGAFLVTWLDFGSDAIPPENFPRGQLFANDGAPLGTEMDLQGSTVGHLSMDVDSQGDFTVVWGGPLTLPGEMEVRRYSSSGSLLLDTELGEGFYPAVTTTESGRFAVAYQSSYDTSSDVLVRIFDSLGMPLNNAWVVNTYTSGEQARPDIASDALGDFVVTWHSAQDGDSRSVHGQQFSSDGTPWSDELQVNTYTTGGQWMPAVAAQTLDTFVVAWQSEGQDGDGNGVFAQRFGTLSTLFRDGFESGDTVAWTSESP